MALDSLGGRFHENENIYSILYVSQRPRPFTTIDIIPQS